MPLQTFANSPAAYARYTLTLPNVNTVTTATKGVLATTVLAAGSGRVPDGYHHVIATPAEALPTGIVYSGAYFDTSDSKIYFQFGNPTASNYTGADTIDFDVVVL